MGSKPKSSTRSAPARRKPAPAVPSTGGEVAAVFHLPAICTLRDAAEIKQGLCALSDEMRRVQIDAGAVERIDTAILQMLVAFHHERLGRGLTTGWTGRGQAFDAAAERLGLYSLLGLKPDTAS
jgi:phospholipid transport system transporter-binding protein